MSEQPFPFALQGGLDLVTPAVVMPPGRLIAVQNYESVSNGYGRIGGFERFDGRAKPSEATYYLLQFDAGLAVISAGNTVTGGTSGATGTALQNAVVQTGAYGSSSAAGYLVLTEITGTFQDNEALKVGGVTKSTANGTPVSRAASTASYDTAWIIAATENRRNAIAKPPSSSGPIRGGFTYNGVKYCVRDNAGATAGTLFKATASGWVAQSLGRTVNFTSGGAYVIVDGDTITGATSGATAVVGRVILTAGDWAAGTAAGRLILTTQTGNLQAENLNVGANLNVATIAGNSTALSLAAGGRYTFKTHNFFGQAATRRVYGANGVGNAFEWDGTVFVPIISGVATDTPLFLDVHQQHLMLGFVNGSIVTSDPGEPYSFTASGGSSEIAVGFKLSGLLAQVAGVMVIFGTPKGVSVLYGTDADTWDLKGLAEDAGAYPYTSEMIGTPYYLDDRGVRSLSTTQSFGNFNVGTATEKVQPIFEQKRKDGTTAVASMVVRKKNQYRLFFSDNTGLSIFFRARIGVYGPVAAPEPALFALPFTVSCCWTGEDASGNEELFTADSTGWAYQMDSGPSFDGQPVPALCQINFINCKSPQTVKRFFGADIYLSTPSKASLLIAAYFDNVDSGAGPSASFESGYLVGGGAAWDVSDWDTTSWGPFADIAARSPISSRDCRGEGQSCSLLISSNETYSTEHVLQSITLLQSPRRLKR